MGADEQPAGGTIGNATLWLGILGPPTLWLHQLLINYIFVSWSCRHEQTWPLHLVSLAALLATAAFGTLLFAQWRKIKAPGRAKFMAFLGWLSSGLFFLAMLTQEIAAGLFNPCLH